jgi:uncharacterized RmlC-like cupin family protein
MSLVCPPLKPGPVPGVRVGRLPGAESVNVALAQALEARWDAPETRRTHQVDGRFENIYIRRQDLPEVEPVLDAAESYARQILGRSDLRLGFWLNRMAPGEHTGLHSHEEDDELLSGVYYVQVPKRSGRLLLHHGGRHHALEPLAGELYFFAPSVPHAVETNQSTTVRLSIAFNFGPSQAERVG